jgi:hypothetical protein
MDKLFNIINVGYATNSSEVKVVFKKKYIFVLEKLLKLNCIDNYIINKDFILIKLRYFQNDPLFFFSIRSKAGNKMYKKFSSSSKNLNFSSNLSLFFTNKGLLTGEELFFNKLGGEHIVDVLFLDKK